MNKRNGFTLIELLVVISIIGVLTAISLTSFSRAQKQARDATRKSDLNQYRISLESYSINNNSTYPFKGSGADTDAFCDSGDSGNIIGYIASCPADPLATQTYRYVSGPLPAIYYILYADLETGNYWYVCSNGNSGDTAAPSIGLCN